MKKLSLRTLEQTTIRLYLSRGGWLSNDTSSEVRIHSNDLITPQLAWLITWMVFFYRAQENWHDREDNRYQATLYRVWFVGYEVLHVRVHNAEVR